MYKTVTTDYFRHNLKEIILEVLDGKEIVLQYGKKGKIKLTPTTTKKKTKVHKLVAKLNTTIQTKKLAQPSYKNNHEMYEDLYE